MADEATRKKRKDAKRAREAEQEARLGPALTRVKKDAKFLQRKDGRQLSLSEYRNLVAIYRYGMTWNQLVRAHKADHPEPQYIGGTVPYADRKKAGRICKLYNFEEIKR